MTVAPVSAQNFSADRKTFRPLADGYVLDTGQGLRLEVRQVRRSSHELWGEVEVLCDWPGARTFEGSLHAADFNFSSARARVERGKQLADRAKTTPDQFDWVGLVEELSQRVLRAERSGSPPVQLHEVTKPDKDESFEVCGIPLLRRHPMIWFGDGGAAKSYMALYVAGILSSRTVKVLYCDWEFAGEDHRLRLERLFGDEMPAIWYTRCEQPLVSESARIRRFIDSKGIEYVICDSVAFAADGPAEAQDTASRYFRAVRQFGVGSLHLAHTTKAEDGDQKPFGSTFWHNSARATWFMKRASESAHPTEVTLALYHRKANTGAKLPPKGFHLDFTGESTAVTPIAVEEDSELALSMSMKQRMYAALKSGAKTPAELSELLGEKADSISRKARQFAHTFTRVLSADGVARIGLVTRRNES